MRVISGGRRRAKAGAAKARTPIAAGVRRLGPKAGVGHPDTQNALPQVKTGAYLPQPLAIVWSQPAEQRVSVSQMML